MTIKSCTLFVSVELFRFSIKFVRKLIVVGVLQVLLVQQFVKMWACLAMAEGLPFSFTAVIWIDMIL